MRNETPIAARRSTYDDPEATFSEDWTFLYDPSDLAQFDDEDLIFVNHRFDLEFELRERNPAPDGFTLINLHKLRDGTIHSARVLSAPRSVRPVTKNDIRRAMKETHTDRVFLGSIDHFPGHEQLDEHRVNPIGNYLVRYHAGGWPLENSIIVQYDPDYAKTLRKKNKTQREGELRRLEINLSIQPLIDLFDEKLAQIIHRKVGDFPGIDFMPCLNVNWQFDYDHEYCWVQLDRFYQALKGEKWWGLVTPENAYQALAREDEIRPFLPYLLKYDLKGSNDQTRETRNLRLHRNPPGSRRGHR